MRDFAGIAAGLGTEREMRTAEFGVRLAAWRGKRLALFGTGANAFDVLERYAGEFDFVLCADEAGEVRGHAVASLADALAGGVDAVVIAAKPSSVEPVYARIADTCATAGVPVLDLYGCDQGALRRERDERVAAGFDGLVQSLAGYDVLCIDDDARCLVNAGVEWYDPMACSEADGVHRRLAHAALSRGMALVLIEESKTGCAAARLAGPAYGPDYDIEILDPSELGYGKENGLFRVIARAYEGKRILHVGDEPYRDGVIPQLFGIDAWCLPEDQAHDQGVVEDAPELAVPELPDVLNDAEGALVELARQGADSRDDALRRYAYGALGPLVCAYVQWLSRRVLAEGASQVLFAARDGWVMQQVYDRYRAFRPELSLPPSTYFHTSRKAAALPLLSSVNAFAHFSARFKDLTPTEMLARIFCIDDAEVADDSPTAEARFAATLANRERIAAMAQSQREATMRHLEALDVAEGDCPVLADFVAAGTTQVLLEHALPLSFAGRYVGRRPEPGARNRTEICSYVGDDSYLVRTFMRHEAFFSSPEPPVDSYAPDGSVVFAEEQRPDADLAALSAAHVEVLAFADAYFADPRSAQGEVRWEVADALVATYDDPMIEMSILDSWTARAQTQGFGLAKPATRTVHDVLLGLLHEFDAVCRRHGLTYTAVHGTLLGAVRHGGFVPWDDDLDVAMPRADFDRLCALPASEFKDSYFLQTVMSDPGCFYGGYAKLRDSSTTALEQINSQSECNQGMWLDILPLDYCGPRDADVDRQQRAVTQWQRALYAQTYSSVMNPIADANPKKKSAYYIVASALSRKVLAKGLEGACKAHRASDDLTIFACYYAWGRNRNRFAARDLDDLVRVPFEDTTIPVPRSHDAWLAARYGEDWREEPDVVPDHTHANVEIDPATPYAQTLARRARDE